MSDVDGASTVRAFARSVRARLGELESGWADRGRPLNQTLLLRELRHGALPLSLLRSRLDLDSGYASRLVHALEAEGLVRIVTDDLDARARTLELTDAGRVEAGELEALVDDRVAELLDELGGVRRRRMLEAMGTVARILDGVAVEVEDADPAHPEVAEAHRRYVAELAAAFPSGFDPGDLTAEVDRYRPPHGACVVAWLDGRLLGTVALAPLDPAGPDDAAPTPIREVKRMWVPPEGRGRGIGRRLLSSVEARARVLGTGTLRLDTNEVLARAVDLYDRAGYRRVDRYNDNPYATHFFEKRLR